MKTVTPTKLRQNIYDILDRVAKTGEPIGVKRGGVLLTIVPPVKKSRLDAFKQKRNVIRGDPEDLVHCDWSKYWKPKYC